MIIKILLAVYLRSPEKNKPVPERSMKMAVKVLIKRKVPKEKEKELLSLITQLRVLASKENVYISGETMRNAKKPPGIPRHQHLAGSQGLEGLAGQQGKKKDPEGNRQPSGRKDDLRCLLLPR